MGSSEQYNETVEFIVSVFVITECESLLDDNVNVIQTLKCIYSSTMGTQTMFNLGYFLTTLF